ncbi:Dyp-type peroxidase [Streptomyces sp. 35G-GA-8]|uniref:Dyp-type peroxidase n=1 Tax=Streptomyces sp. 35G-GA-8 TaxID=2939434 RepID=UPI00201EDC47|nr:Dyp-type peroxidase [Streptomyces sp. 35G-GA-8]MCL7377077.1 Dyp-type peroxidase [Streptomyces sp. 35G-GA-8]
MLLASSAAGLAVGGAVVYGVRDGAGSGDAGDGSPGGGPGVLGLAQLRGVRPGGRVVMVALDRGARDGESRAILRELVSGLRGVERAGLAVGVGLGASVFGVAADRPRQLVDMPSFPGDLLDPARSHGDVLVEVAGDRVADVRAAVDRLLPAVPGWRERWRIEGFRAGNREEGGRGLARNPFHFTEGFGNPAGERETADRALVRAGQGEPDWAVGGSYQVVRVIRLATELWDKDSVPEQERIIGRRRDGRWLDGAPTDEEPNFAADPKGRLTPLDSHVRLAAPDRRDPPPLVRRSYSYDRGDGDSGLVFSCFQRDLAKGFEAVQKRLEGEAMAKYLLTTGGGYYFVPPPGDAWTDRVGQR